MTAGYIIRRTLTFPGRSPVADQIVACAIPGPSWVGGVGYAPADVATFEPAPDAIVAQRWDKSVRRIELPVNGCLPSAIALAPDSPIAEFDIAFRGDGGEMERHRVSAGNPFVGVPEGADFAQVSIPDSIPVLDATASTAIYWDGVNLPNEDGESPARVIGWPLRMEMWFGDVPPIRSHLRAAHIAHAIMSTAETTRLLYVCVSGRKRVSVIATAATGTISCFAIGGIKDTNHPTIDTAHEIQLPLNPAGDLTLSLTATPRIIEMNAVSRPLLKVNVTATGTVQVHVRAED